MTPKTLDKYIAALKKKAAASGMTQAEYEAELNKMMDEMAQQYLANKITSAEYSKVSNQISNAAKSMTLQGKASPAAPAAQTAVGLAPQGMAHAEYIGLWEALNKKKKAGLISQDEYTQLGTKLDKAYTGKKSLEETEKEIGCDPGTLATDDAIIKLGKEFKKVYGQASQEMQAQLDKFLKEYGPEMKDLEMKFIDGTITEEELKHLKLMTLQKKVLGQKVDQLTGVMTNANKKAMAMIHGEQLNVFAENANWQSYQLEKDTKMDLMFSVYDESTAEKLLKDKPELLPRKEVNGKKDQAWNRKIIAGAVLQGVIQGDSIPKLAKRIAVQTGETNMKAMTRYARTAMTGAQNSGRVEMLHKATGMGIKVKKTWLATLDSRTRDSHQKLDGETVGVDDKFSNGLMYPGDPNGAGAEVWNCRCTLIYDYEGFPNDPTTDQRRQYDEWDETVTVTKKDKNGKEYQKEETIHHRDSTVIQDMSYGEWKAAKEGSKLNDLNAAKYQLAEAQKAVVQAKVKEDKVYEGLWKDPVTLADYPAKKAGIQAKRDWYDQEIQKYKDAQAMGSSWATDEKIKDLEKKKKLLNEFEKRGQLIEKRDTALKTVQEIYNQVGYQGTASAPAVAQKAQNKAKKAAAASGGASAGAGGQSGAGLSLGAAGAKKTQFAPDAWDAATKRAAPFYDRRVDTDKVLRPDLDKTWANLTDEEKYAIWEYTHNSHPMNQPLCGYNDGWRRGNYAGGPDKTNWGYQDSYGNRNLRGYGEMSRFGDSRGQPSFKKAITDMTNAIEKSTMKQNIWLKRQSDNSGLAGLMEATGFDFNKIKALLDGNPSQAELDSVFVGQRGRMFGFTSCGMAKDAHWNGNVYYKIYVPKGTKAIYTEPQSHFGASMGGRDRIYKPGSSYSGVNSEAEVVIQRGTTYRITGIRKSGSDYHVEMEVVEQPDYFVYGDEDTYNDGKTRHKK